MLVEPGGHLVEVLILDPAQVTRPLYVGLASAEQKFEPLAVGVRRIDRGEEGLLHLKGSGGTAMGRKDAPKSGHTFEIGLRGQVSTSPDQRHVATPVAFVEQRVFGQALPFRLGLLSIDDGHGVAMPSQQVAVTLYGGKFIKEQNEQGRRFLRAFLRGVRDHNDSLDDTGNFSGAKGDAIIDILVKYGPFRDPQIYKSFVLAYCDPDGKLDMQALQADIDVFGELKMLERPVELAKVVDTSFLDWALQQLGPYKKAA